MIKKKGNYKIIPGLGGLFTVVNLLGKQRYTVDIYEPSCSCPAFKFNKRNKKGKKKTCEHIHMTKGLKTIKMR